MPQAKYKILVAVGSRQDQVCSVGSFARAEMRALVSAMHSTALCEPDGALHYPIKEVGLHPDLILFHSPSLLERGKLFAPFKNLLKLRAWYPKAKLISVVHEYSEAPLQWRLRQKLLIRLSSAAIANSHADYEGVKNCGAPVLRAPLGPTLFDESLYGLKDESKFSAKVQEARKKFGRPELAHLKWVVHPGLLAPGKGLDALAEIVAKVKEPFCLIVMGAKGPKAEDQAFAQSKLGELAGKLGERFIHIDSPGDAEFANVLQASDVVLLPYDEGLSERRSSFLSAMSFGALVVTTRGKYTEKLGVTSSGVAFANSATELSAKLDEALHWDSPIKKRIQNVEWAEKRSWPNRVRALQSFFDSISSKNDSKSAATSLQERTRG